MTVRVIFCKGQYGAVVSAYGPTMGAKQHEQQALHNEVGNTLSHFLKEGNLFFLNPLCTLVPHEVSIMEQCCEGRETKFQRDNRISTKCAQQGLVMTHALFRQHDKLAESWCSSHVQSNHS